MGTAQKMKHSAGSDQTHSHPQGGGRNEGSIDGDAEGALACAHDVLQEIRALLHDYAPAWFTPRHDQRLDEALRQVRRSIASRPVSRG